MKLLLDTNIVLDVVEKREPFYRDAVALLKSVNAMDFVITRNKKDFVNSAIKAITPIEFLESYG